MREQPNAFQMRCHLSPAGVQLIRNSAVTDSSSHPHFWHYPSVGASSFRRAPRAPRRRSLAPERRSGPGADTAGPNGRAAPSRDKHPTPTSVPAAPHEVTGTPPAAGAPAPRLPAARFGRPAQAAPLGSRRPSPAAPSRVRWRT